MKKPFLQIVNAFMTISIIVITVGTLKNMQQQYQEARMKAKFSELGQVMPRNFGAFVSAIESSTDFDAEHLDAFILYYEKMVEYLPQKADAHGILGFCYNWAGRKDQAIAQYRQAIAINPHFFWFQYNLASIYFDQKAYEQAIPVYKEALNQSLETALIFIRFSQNIYHPLLSKRSDYHERLIAEWMDQDKEKAYRFIVQGHIRLKQYGEALAIANYALTLYDDPESQEFFFYSIGTALFNQSYYEKAFYFFQKVIELNPENADAFYFIGLSAKELGRQDIGLRYIANSQFLQQQGKSKPLPTDPIRLRSF